MVAIQQGLRDEGVEVSMVKLCRWFGVARRTVYYQPRKSPAVVDPALASPIKALIEEEPSFGYRTVAGLLGMNNGLVFTSRHYTHLVRSYGLRQEFITPHCPQQNGMVERVIRTLKEQCAHRHRFETHQHAMRVIGDWIQFYNHRRPHQALGMKTPAEAYALTA